MNIPIKAPEISRRGMLTGLGGLSFCLALGVDGMRLVTPVAAATGDAQMSPWVRIAPDGMVTILTPGAEMGQGSMTSLPLILAEEMDADWSKVVLEWAPSTPEVYGYNNRGVKSMSISGSRAVQMYFPDLRIAGAQVRKVLLQNAAEKWGVDAGTLKTEPGFVVDPASGKKLSYGEIAAFGKVPETLPAVDKSELKPRSQFRLIGKSMPRRDIPSKVNGQAQYAMDVKLPGMVYASILHSPVHGGAPESWNDAEIKAMAGVISTVALPDSVAIVAQSFEQAMIARKALKVTWKNAEATGYNSVEALEEYAKIHADPNAKREPVETKGDTDAAFAGAAKVYTANYRSDYGYHAQMEPCNAVARFNEAGDHLEIWNGCQDLGRSRDLPAKAVKLKPEQVTVHQQYIGGGFGRRSDPDYAVEAALIAKAVKKPVKLVWTREDDLAHGMFRPQSFQCVEAATDASGKVVGWRHCAVGDGGAQLLAAGVKLSLYYNIPNQHVELRGISHGVRLKTWRAVAHNFNLFAIEGLVDQMAADQGMDPIEFRIQRMGMIPRARKVFEKVAEMSNWKGERAPGRALGIAVSERSGSLAAGVVEASLNRDTGKLSVHKVWIAVDGGIIVQPDAAKANVESGVIYGLSNVLHERLTVKDGVVEQSNFNGYTLMRMSDAPEQIDVHFVDSDLPPAGVGEISTPCMMPAVANAFHKLTGKRLYHMPFTPERVKEVLQA